MYLCMVFGFLARERLERAAGLEFPFKNAVPAHLNGEVGSKAYGAALHIATVLTFKL